jgi:methylated-DNA-[protein]-cysteine S-methyltransferase
MTCFSAIVPTPVGDLFCTANAESVLSVTFKPFDQPVSPNAVLEKLRDELARYFAGSLRKFTVPVELPNGSTPHRLAVWDSLLTVPYGQTVSYRGIAEAVGSSPIAVGQAVGANPILILIPCHRIVGSNGALTGYAGGLERKKALLDLEALYRD